ncbi:MAG: hypothetical protein ACLFP8_06930 [Alphaproteobacteria bacterium]
MRRDSFIDSLGIRSGLIATLAILALGGCIGTTYPYMRTETAQRIAAPAWMIRRDITAEPFLLRAYERIHDRGGVANLYIEGQGNKDASDPTPSNPVALHLASKDKAENVIYIARPCQYTSMVSPAQKCDPKYWNEDSFSQTVLDSYNKALEGIITRYGIRSFNLIGYSGGGTIATLLAAHRADIKSVRTVAGILDHTAYTQETGAPPFNNSLNPVSETMSLAKTPQYHFVGGADDTVPPAVLHSYLQSMPPGNCVQTMFVQEASHNTGWVDKWPELLELPVSCYSGDGADIAQGTNGNTIPGTTPDTIISPTMPRDLPQTVREKPEKP